MMPRGRSVSLNYILYKYVDTISNDISIVDILIDKVNHDKSDKYLRNIASAKFMGCQNHVDALTYSFLTSQIILRNQKYS